MMGAEQQKFKVGDKVRLTENYATWPAGTEGVVTTVSAGYGWAGDDADDLIYTDTVSGVYARRLELVPTWQPKVGDRVRFTTTKPAYRADYSSGALTVSYINDNGEDGETVVTVSYDDRDYKQACLLSDLEPIRAPATLTIEAGKFYKTRDGRKVGPAFVTGSTTTFGEKGNWSSAVWTDTGRQSTRDDTTTELANDIIAEWIDEPAIANDNAAPAKFKVGDRVRIAKACLTSKSSFVGREFTIQRQTYDINGESTWAGDKVGGYVWLTSELELIAPTPTAIVALIEDGVAKPATRPVVHASQEAATTEASRLALLHPGHEFGEWWGNGIQRGYGLKEKRFSLFNTGRWSDPAARPACCDVVPLLYVGQFATDTVDWVLDSLKETGSQAAPGFMKPEGIIVFMTASSHLYKVLAENDDTPKGVAA